MSAGLIYQQEASKRTTFSPLEQVLNSIHRQGEEKQHVETLKKENLTGTLKKVKQICAL